MSITTAKSTIEVKAKLSEKYKLTNHRLACQYFGIEIYWDKIRTGISHGQKAFITTILRRLGMEYSDNVSKPMNPNVTLNLAEDRGEKELKDITDYQAVVGSPMYAAFASRPDISYAVTSLCHYNSRPSTSHITAAKIVLQYLQSKAEF
jgi:hypothetical protein